MRETVLTNAWSNRFPLHVLLLVRGPEILIFIQVLDFHGPPISEFRVIAGSDFAVAPKGAKSVFVDLSGNERITVCFYFAFREDFSHGSSV